MLLFSDMLNVWQENQSNYHTTSITFLTRHNAFDALNRQSHKNNYIKLNYDWKCGSSSAQIGRLALMSPDCGVIIANIHGESRPTLPRIYSHSNEVSHTQSTGIYIIIHPHTHTHIFFLSITERSRSHADA